MRTRGSAKSKHPHLNARERRHSLSIRTDVMPRRGSEHERGHALSIGTRGRLPPGQRARTRPTALRDSHRRLRANSRHRPLNARERRHSLHVRTYLSPPCRSEHERDQPLSVIRTGGYTPTAGANLSTRASAAIRSPSVRTGGCRVVASTNAAMRCLDGLGVLIAADLSAHDLPSAQRSIAQEAPC